MKTKTPFFILSLVLFCNGGDEQEETRAPVPPGGPKLVPGEVYWEAPHSAEERERLVREITEKLGRIFALVEAGELERLPEFVSRERGLYVDLKAHQTYERLLSEVTEKEGYLQMFYLDTEALREYTEDGTRLSVRDLLRLTKEVRVEYFVEDEDTCELRLHLTDRPDLDYFLNNPYFIREDGDWKIYRLF